MRVSQLLLPLVAAGASAFVIPDDDAMVQVNVKTDRAPKFHDLKESLLDAADEARHAITDAFETAYDDTSSAVEELADFARKEQHEAEAWVRHQETNIEDALERVSDFDVASIYDDLKHQTKEWFEDLDLSSDEDEDDEHHRHPKKPHHPPHHKKPKYTVYELIKKSKYTSRLAEVVDDFPEVVEKLNGSESDFTLFAPTNRAFEKIPKGAKLPKEFLLKLLQYHVVPDVYPAVRVLKSNTLPTVLEGAGLSDRPDKTVQRLAVRLSLFKGATINFFSKLVAVNIRGTNGIVHGVDTLLIPPPKALQLVQGFPAAFSTFELALWKTGLVHKLNESDSLGGTLFTPSNRAWNKMGARANQFLFSRYGAKYLKALLKYHIVPKTTLYSDAIYVAHRDDPGHDHAEGDAEAQRTFHIDLPTLLDDKYLSIDVARWSRFVDIRINGFQNVAVQNVPAYDGVLQILGNVLIPPKRPGQHEKDDNLLAAEEVSVEELRERLEPFVEHDDDDDDYTLDSVPTEKMAAEQLPLGFGMEL